MEGETAVEPTDAKKGTSNQLSAEEKLKKDRCTMFVGNIPNSITKRQFEGPFKQFGKIVSSRFRSAPVKEKYKKANKKFGVMRKDFIDGIDASKLTQNGYIVFASEESVQKTIETGKVSGTDLYKSGHMIRVDYVVKPNIEAGTKSTGGVTGAVKKFDRKKSIYIPHLPASATDIDVQTAVEAQDESLKGSVRGVRIVKTDKSGSFAFVLLSERVHATRLVKSGAEGIDYQFPSAPSRTTLKFLRIMQDGEIVKEKEAKAKQMEESAKQAAKKSLSRMKWQTRLTRKGSAKVVSHHAMPRKERQEKMNGAALRMFRKTSRK